VKTAVVFRGTPEDALALVNAVVRNCTCRSGPCAPHDMILEQRTIDRLLFDRWLAERLLSEEFATGVAHS
jgi:hypothetical protein